ncbi:MAG: radical SAM protein [Candidatus Omnitrophota bacterium]
MRILYQPDEYAQQRQRDVKARIYPVLLAMEATYYQDKGDCVYWDFPGGKFDKIIKEPENLPFLTLPIPDRILTKYWEYQSGNYKYLPGTHIQAARDCWYHACKFCAWAKKYPVCETRPVDLVIQEIAVCVKLGIREIFDDSGTFPVGEWLKGFCRKMVSTGLNKKVTLGCNMRFGALDLEDFELMKKAGFRMILWGLESINQSTLDKLNKGIRVEDVLINLSISNNFGFWNHTAIMFGYPWEHKVDAQRTFDFIKTGLLTNKIQSAQASIYDVPECEVVPSYAFDLRKKVYQLYFHPRYIGHRVKEIKSWDDCKYYLRGIKLVWRKNVKKR